MRLVGSVVLCTVLIASLCLAGQTSQLDKEKDRISYSLGHQIGEDIKRQAVEVDPEALRKGVEDGLAGKEPILPRKEMNGILEDLKGRILAAQRKDNLKLADTYREKGSAFLAENAKREGVVMLPSGLQYKVLREGAGRSPGPTDRGTLIDGIEFDSSYSRGQPITFPLNRVIKGWTEGLQLMKPGAKYKFFIPPDLAYGPRGAAPKIGPESTLIFEVQLLSVGNAAPPPADSGMGK